MNRRQKKKKAKADAIKQAIDKVISERAKTGEGTKSAPAAKKEKSAAKVVIDCAKFETKARIHEAFHNEPAFPDYEGNNLDAMFDMLTEVASPTTITVKHLSDWEAAPESFRNNIRKLLERADRENPNVTVVFE